MFAPEKWQVERWQKEYEQSTARGEGNEEDSAVLVTTGAAEVKWFDERIVSSKQVEDHDRGKFMAGAVTLTAMMAVTCCASRPRRRCSYE